MVRRGTMLAALLCAAWPATAVAKWSEGAIKSTTGLNCASIIFGSPRIEQQTSVYAAQQVPDDGSVPSGDEPFWVKVVFGSVGDICGGGGHLLPEFIPPVGVSVVDDPKYPPYWTAWQDGVERRAAEPMVLRPGPWGGTQVTVRDPADGQDKPFIYANNGPFINVYLPMRTTRALNGIGTPEPHCPQYHDSSGACPAAEAGDHLQVFAQVADGGSPRQLIPIIGLFAAAPTATPRGGGPSVPGAPGSPTLAVRTPARIGRAALRRRGLAVTLPPQARGTKVTATLKRRTTTVARGSATGRGGKKRLVLRVRSRRVVAAGKLTLTVKAGAATATRTIRVTR